MFDALGKLEFEGRPLRQLLLDAIRYGERPEVRARLDTAVDHALDPGAVQAPAGGAATRPRRDGRHPRAEKPLVAPPGQPLDAFVCPGHPLLDAVIDVTLERHRDLLRRGAVLVASDTGTAPRVLFSVEHSLQDGSVTRAGGRRVISKRVLYVELDADGVTRHLHYAPYLDYRPLADGEPAADALLARDECSWIGRDLEETVQAYPVARVVPEHLAEVRDARLALIGKTEAAVKDRLTKEISYWDHRAEQLKLDEEAGKTGARLNSGEARRRADTLQLRLQKRFAELKGTGRLRLGRRSSSAVSWSCRAA